MSTTAHNTPASVDTGLLAHDHNIKSQAASKEPIVLEGGFAKHMSNTLEQILDVLRGSTIAEEHGKDVESNFWTMYKKVSNEYDDDFLERAQEDMAIILTFAGLFSAVNSTFIVGMQPNPGDTTNTLMLQLIKVIANGPDAVNINDLSSSTTYPPSTVWMQALAYASLAFSVLAAFGAVMGKQWLSSYKRAPRGGSLEERSLQRQRKLDGLERWYLQTVLGAFLVLLQISLLLFGLSLSANMFTWQHTIFKVVISATGFGFLFYLTTVVVSLLCPDSPFQTAGSALVAAIRKNSTITPNTFGKSSAIRWILETSTKPEVVEAAVMMVPRVQWPPNVSAIYARLVDNFAMFCDRPELYVAYGKALTHIRIQTLKTNSMDWKERTIWRSSRDMSRFICDAFMDARLACDQLMDTSTENESARQKHMTDVCAALRILVVYGRPVGDHVSLPDDEELIWKGDLRWHHSDGSPPSCNEFDWLIDYLGDKSGDKTDDETEGDALLALSAMHGLGSPNKRHLYVKVLIRCMARDRLPRVRHAALRAAVSAREDLASISPGVDAKLLEELSHALLTTIQMQDSTSFINQRNLHYLRLIFALAKNNDWCKRLTYHAHVNRFISLLDIVLASKPAFDNFYLAMILLRIEASGNWKDIPNIDQKKRWTLIKSAWTGLSYTLGGDLDIIEALPVLATETKLKLPDDAASTKLATLGKHVHRVLQQLQQRTRNQSEGPGVVDSALPIVQDLHTKLSSYTKQPNISQCDNNIAGPSNSETPNNP